MSQKQQATATNGQWQLFVLGYSNETVRKAIILNILTKDELQARVSEKKEKDKTVYTVIEAVDQKKNQFVNFMKTFTVVNTK